jgi:hypothetical protein
MKKLYEKNIYFKKMLYAKIIYYKNKVTLYNCILHKCIPSINALFCPVLICNYNTNCIPKTPDNYNKGYIYYDKNLLLLFQMYFKSDKHKTL